MSTATFSKFLENHYDETSLERAKFGDLVVFYVDLRIKDFPDPDTTNPYWYEIKDEVYHAAIFLEDDMILQKKNDTSRLFVLNTIKEQLEAIREDFRVYNPAQGSLINQSPRVRIFRKR